MDSLIIYKQWKTIHVPANRNGSKNDEDEEPKFYQKLQMIKEQVTVGEVYEDFQQHFEGVTAHVNLKYRLTHSKMTSVMSIPGSCKQIMQWPIKVSKKAKSKVHYGQEAVSIYLCVLCITKTKPKHS